MKKFKILPTVLMLIMCVGVLAVGIFAMTPMHNDIDAIIAVKGVNSPVKIEVFIDNTSGPALITYDEVRKGEDIALDEISKELLKFEPEGVNSLSEVPSKKLILRVTNLDTNKQLGAYFLEEELAANTLINTRAEICTEDGTLKVADAYLPSYTVLDKNNQTNSEPKATQDLVIELNVATWDDAEGDLFFYLYIEEYAADLETEYEKTTSSVIVAPTAQAQALSTSVFENANLTAEDVAGINFVSTPNVVVPEGIQAIMQNAFSDCTNLKQIAFPTSITTIDKYAFVRCTGLTSILIPKSVKTVGSVAFAGCSNLISVTIEEGVTQLGGSAFEACSKLSEITLPSTLNSIGGGCFIGCGLTQITIHSKVLIGQSAFMDCNDLKTIYNNSTLDIQPGSTNYGHIAFYATKVYNKGVLFAEIIEQDGLKYMLTENAKAVIDTVHSQLTSATLAADCTAIAECAFQYCTKLTEITIPSPVTSIGNYAFDGCSALASVTISEGVQTIGDYAFRNCKLLTEITIPSSVTIIGSYAFDGCSALASVTISEGVQTIRGYSFRNCVLLTEITIPGSVTSINNHVFNGCSALTSVTISEGVQEIWLNAFYNCHNLKTITVAKNTDLIRSYTLPTLTQTGKTFKGWYTNAEGTGTAVTQISADKHTAETTYYAVWQ